MPDIEVSEAGQQLGVIAPGTIFAEKFEILTKLGEGGMSVVYKARHLSFDKVVALKLLQARSLADAKAFQRFRREALAISALDHPNIVRILAMDMEGAQPYMAMEYIDGCSLAEFIRERGKIEAEQCVHIISQAARALAHAHDKGVVHRDIKPANIMLSGDDRRVQVVDFGVARLTDINLIDEQKLTQTNSVIGTPFYMSPEQCEKKPVDARSDMYSLGCVLYELLCGRPPHQGDSPYAVMLSHIHETAPELPSSVPMWLAATCSRMLQRDPAARFQDMNEVLNALTQHGAPPNTVRRKRKSAGKSRKHLVPVLVGVAIAATVGLLVFAGFLPSQMKSHGDLTPVGTYDEAVEQAQKFEQQWKSTHSVDAQTKAKEYFEKAAEIARSHDNWLFAGLASWECGMMLGVPGGKQDAQLALIAFKRNAERVSVQDPQVLASLFERCMFFKDLYGEEPFPRREFAQMRMNWCATLCSYNTQRHNYAEAQKYAVQWLKAADHMDSEQSYVEVVGSIVDCGCYRGNELKQFLEATEPRVFSLVPASKEEQESANGAFAHIAEGWFQFVPAKSELILRHALAGTAKWFGPDSLKTAEMEHMLAWNLRQQNKTNDAQALWKHALPILAGGQEERHRRAVILVCGEMRGQLFKQAVYDYKAAIPLTELALQMERRILKDHRDSNLEAQHVGNLCILGRDLYSASRYADALKVNEEVFTYLKDPKSDAFLEATLIKAKCLCMLGRFAESDEYFAKGIALAKENHPHSAVVVYAYSDRAFTAAAKQRWAQAIEAMLSEQQAMKLLIARGDKTFGAQNLKEVAYYLDKWKAAEAAGSPHAN